jgi:hypothetical protein
VHRSATKTYYFDNVNLVARFDLPPGKPKALAVE